MRQCVYLSPMTIPGFRPGDFGRRDFFRGTFGDWVDKVVREAEERVVVQRYYRPPGCPLRDRVPGGVHPLRRVHQCLSPCMPSSRCRPDGGLAAGTPHHRSAASQPCIACPDMPCVAACPTGALTLPEDGWTGSGWARGTGAGALRHLQGHAVPGSASTPARWASGRSRWTTRATRCCGPRAASGAGSASGSASRRPRRFIPSLWSADA